MNQWIVAFLILWLGTGALIVLGMFADAATKRAKRNKIGNL